MKAQEKLDRRLRYDEFVERVRPDPEANEQPVFFSGYVGEASRSGYHRVYLSAALTNYVEIREADVLYSLPNTEEEDPLGGSKFWLKKTAEVYYGNDFMETKTKEAFTKGDLMDYYQTNVFNGFEKTTDLLHRRQVTDLADMECGYRSACLNASVVCLQTLGCHYGKTRYQVDEIACRAGSIFDVTDVMEQVVRTDMGWDYRYQALQNMFGNNYRSN